MKKVLFLLLMTLSTICVWGQGTKFESAKEKTGVLYDETVTNVSSTSALCNAGTSPIDFDFKLVTLTNISTSAKTSALAITVTCMISNNILVSRHTYFIDKDEFANIISSLKFLKSKTNTSASITARNKVIKFAKGSSADKIDFIVNDADYYHFDADELIAIFIAASQGKPIK